VVVVEAGVVVVVEAESAQDKLIESLPAALKPCVRDGWKIISRETDMKFSGVLTEEEYPEQFESKTNLSYSTY
jgi:hypothetical protein